MAFETIIDLLHGLRGFTSHKNYFQKFNKLVAMLKQLTHSKTVKIVSLRALFYSEFPSKSLHYAPKLMHYSQNYSQ